MLQSCSEIILKENGEEEMQSIGGYLIRGDNITMIGEIDDL